MEFRIISIAVLIVFYGCYFVKMLRQKKQGIRTDQIGKDKVGFVKFVEITMKIAAVLVFAANRHHNLNYFKLQIHFLHFKILNST